MEDLGRVYEEVKVLGKELVEKVKDLIHEGNVRRVIIEDDRGVRYRGDASDAVDPRALGAVRPHVDVDGSRGTDGRHGDGARGSSSAAGVPGLGVGKQRREHGLLRES